MIERLIFKNIDYSRITTYQEYFKSFDLWAFREIPSEITGFNFPIYMTNAKEASYPLRVYVRTKAGIFVPFKVTSKGGTVCSFEGCDITDRELLNLDVFLSINRNIIFTLGRKEKDFGFIKDTIVKGITDYCINDVNEMTKISATVAASVKNRMLWIDENEQFQGHAPRIKFQHRKKDTNSRHFASMMITPPYTVFNLENSDISKDELYRIKTFVVANSKELLNVIWKKMDINEFRQIMIRVNLDGSLIYPESTFYVRGEKDGDIEIIVDKETDKVNLRKNGSLMYDIWFDDIFQTSKNPSLKPSEYFVATLGEKMYKLYKDGTKKEFI